MTTLTALTTGYRRLLRVEPAYAASFDANFGTAETYASHGRNVFPAVSVFEVRMHWIQVTQANTGVKLNVNMELVILVAPNRKGGANLMLTVREQSPGSGKDSARLIPVVETQSEVMALLSASKKT